MLTANYNYSERAIDTNVMENLALALQVADPVISQHRDEYKLTGKTIHGPIELKIAQPKYRQNQEPARRIVLNLDSGTKSEEELTMLRTVESHLVVRKL